ncbi:MAG TPA: magnesium transporter CorA family protein [Acetobacteraceae bacterium]|nr:magnesium transporter CorA family protein [Acetobacteraceae bacterium]
MILANTGTQPRRPLSPDSAAEHAAHAVWLDLLDATEEERAFVERIADLRVPARTELSEIERSSRLAARNEVLTLSTPMISKADGKPPIVTPLGFVLSRDRLLTIRYAPMRSFDSYAEQLYDAGQPAPGSVAMFVGLLEAIVDRLADVLESIGADLERLSHQIFRPEATGVRRVRRESAILRSTLAEVGRTGEHVSSLRDSLVGISRIFGFVIEVATDWTPPELRGRFTTLRQDIASLNDYDVQITGKVQFLLDATLGFINIQQNNIIKVLTVASIVGIPPTLIAGIYGMNFKAMPELNWAWGYPYGLTLIALSAILPLLWFWRHGWL